MALFTKLEFTEEQKKEYGKLKKFALVVGIPGLILTFVFALMGERELSDAIISITLAILVIYPYNKYREILSKSEKTVEYSKFQKEIYIKGWKYFIIPSCFGALILMYFCFRYHISPWWLMVFVIICSVGGGIWASWYEKKKFGSIKRAP
jgi:hypothetical protein